VSTVLVSTTSTGRLFHREGAATQNARLASSVRVLGTIRRGVLGGRSVRDGMWSFSSELRYGGDDMRWALNVRVATCVCRAPGLADSVTTAAEAWHWSCCCSASQHIYSVVLVAAVCCLRHVKNYDWLIDWRRQMTTDNTCVISEYCIYVLAMKQNQSDHINDQWSIDRSPSRGVSRAAGRGYLFRGNQFQLSINWLIFTARLLPVSHMHDHQRRHHRSHRPPLISSTTTIQRHIKVITVEARGSSKFHRQRSSFSRTRRQFGTVVYSPACTRKKHHTKQNISILHQRTTICRYHASTYRYSNRPIPSVSLPV